MSTKRWDPGTGPSMPGPAGLLQWLRRRTAPTERPDEPVAAVLFDMDGLLVDSEPVWTVAEEEFAASYGRVFTPEIKEAIIGRGIGTAVPIMLSMLGVEDDPVAAGERLLARVIELFHEPGRLVLQPGALDLLRAVHAAQVPAALVSSSYRRLMDAALEVIGSRFFAVTVAGDEVTEAKPHPEPYLTAARRLGADPARCVVLEDSASGAAAGLGAGCVTVLVPTFPPAVPPAGMTVVGSLTEVTLNGLRGLVRAR